jgi:tetratricopeptide (TPR) repeat protein
MKANRVLLLSLGCLCPAAYGQDRSAGASVELFPESAASDGSSTVSSPSAQMPPVPTSPSPARHGTDTRTGRSSDEVLAEVGRRLESIGGEVAANGPRSTSLIKGFDALAALYEEIGEHVLAIDALDHALDVTRINKGLYSLDQAPLLERMIAGSDAVKDYAQAASFEAQLLELVARNPDDPRVASILGSLADRRMDSFHRLLEEGTPPQLTISIGSGIGPPLGEPPPPTGRYAALASLWKARRLYIQALTAAVENGGSRIADLFELEEKVLATYTLEVSKPELEPALRASRKQAVCETGEEAFETHAVNASKFESPAAEAAALLRLGDWRLLCSNNGRARQTYREAHELLLDEDVPESTVARLLSPDVPKALPASSAPREPADTAERHSGYVDVSFVIGRYGNSRKVEILDKSASTSKEIEKRVKSYIAQHRFRPRFVDGQLARADRVRMRYYYDE